MLNTSVDTSFFYPGIYNLADSRWKVIEEKKKRKAYKKILMLE